MDLDDKGNTGDQVLEIKNIEFAGNVLSNMLNKLVVALLLVLLLPLKKIFLL